jgi:nucleoside-diphosphate-sugar epimerase
VAKRPGKFGKKEQGRKTMRILITGNMGYVGPCLTHTLKASRPEAELIGYDTGFFADCLTAADTLPERRLARQVFGDMRRLDASVLEGVDAVVHLAAISNDPMGKTYEEITLDVNYRSSVRLAEMAKAAGVKRFVFASSCSMYGAGGDAPKTEKDSLNPLTAYARSKVGTETDLQPLADDDFQVTCLRFATACGMSDRLRLDLVLNDFVAGAVTAKEITILSDGTPWRPLINVWDMGRAIDWALGRDAAIGAFLAVNTGSNRWNYQVKDLAYAVADVIPGVAVSINDSAEPDKRSYRVNFDLYERLAPDHQPAFDLEKTIVQLKTGLEAMHFADAEFRNSRFMRLKALKALRDKSLLDSNLSWT